MAQYYLLPPRLIKAFPALRKAAWRIESWGLGFLFAIVQWLPLATANRVTATLFGLLGPKMPRASKARQNLVVAFPEQDRRGINELTRRTFRHLGMAATELIHLGKIWAHRDERLEFVILPGADIPAPEQRTVYVTAHIGAWQLTSLIGPRYGVTIPIIYAPESNPYLNERLGRLRRAFGSPLISRDGGIRVLMHELDRGHSIGLAIDTRLDSGNPLEFFGHDAWTNTAAARLALRYRCNMVPVLAERLPNLRYRITIYPSIHPASPDVTLVEQGRDMTRQLNALFEKWIRAFPGEWICLKRRWPKAVYRQHQKN